MQAMNPPILPRKLPDYLLSHGFHSVDLPEIQRLCDLDYVNARLTVARLTKERQLFSPVRGLYIVIPPQYRTWGVVPGERFIHSMMSHLRRPYYVSLLSAASRYGASHQQPMVFQVMTTSRVRDRDLGRVRLRFFTSEHASQAPVETATVETGIMRVAAKETTLVDLVTHVDASGGLDNIATICREIGTLKGDTLAQWASVFGRSAVRRVGWFADHFGTVDDLQPLRLAAQLESGEPVELYPPAGRRGRKDDTWGIRVNTHVEPEL
jgi:predicted transcriptional regulator of viral defense system